MDRIIRSISIKETLDRALKEDSEYRGLTISANMSRILFEYFQTNPIRVKKDLKQLSPSDIIKHKRSD